MPFCSKRAARRKPALLAGSSAAFTALTRPDAVLYCFAIPIGYVICRFAVPNTPRPSRRKFSAFFASLIVPILAYVVARRVYFGYWLPNTYFAKRGTSSRYLLNPEKWEGLFRAAWGPATTPLALVLLAAILFVARRRAWNTYLAMIAAYLGIAAMSYVLLPADWMPEYRFATPFFPLLSVMLYETCWLVSTHSQGLARRSVAALLLATLAAATSLSAVNFGVRSRCFASSPTVPLSLIETVFGRGMDCVANAMHIENASMLVPSIGGAFLHSRTRVIDLAGLCDASIARELPFRPNAFHEYVFNVVKPTFIHFNGPWTGWASLYRDPRLLRDYMWAGTGEAEIPLSQKLQIQTDSRRLRSAYRRARSSGLNESGSLQRLMSACQAHLLAQRQYLARPARTRP